MPRFHHANLAVPADGTAAESDFLVSVLGYRRLEAPKEMAKFNVNWFEADDGSQIHLSVDADHVPAAKAHVAIVLGDELDAVARRLTAKGIDNEHFDTPDGNHVVLCRDPAGNRWELRAKA
jgi:predicted enzyme related to lactoylglutathione lyase